MATILMYTILVTRIYYLPMNVAYTMHIFNYKIFVWFSFFFIMVLIIFNTLFIIIVYNDLNNLDLIICKIT